MILYLASALFLIILPLVVNNIFIVLFEILFLIFIGFLKKSAKRFVNILPYYIPLGILTTAINYFVSHNPNIIMSVKLLAVLYAFIFAEITIDSDEAVMFFMNIMPRSTLMLLISFKLIPNMKKRYSKLRQIYAARGIDFDKRKISERVKAYLPVLSVLLEETLETSFCIGEAAYTKGFDIRGRKKNIEKALGGEQNMEYIKIKNLSYKYPDQNENVLNDINLNIKKGELVLLLGVSGSGKSTLLKCISKSIPQFYGGTIGGDIFINGENLFTMPDFKKAREICAVFQDPEKQLFMNKVYREIEFGLENLGFSKEECQKRIYEALQFTNIINLSERDINTLSGGEMQRTAIASAVSATPDILLLDEPTSQLDPSSSEDVISIINKINSELGITILISEQNTEKWFEASDRIIILKQGRIYFDGSSEELYNSSDSYNFKFLPSYLKFFKKAGLAFPNSMKDARQKLFKTFNDKADKLIHNDEIALENESKCKMENNLNHKKNESNTEKVIEIKKLNVSYGKNKVINNFNMDINIGEAHAIVGPNGAGKSTILKSIIGFNKYDGSIKLCQKEVNKMSVCDAAKLAVYISQNPNDYISKDTVFEEVKFTLKNYNIDDDNLVNQTLEELGLIDLKDKNPRDLSGGERQRIAIASMLVLKPKIIILDEPTRGLDYENKEKLLGILRSFKDKGTAILLVTHDMDFACRLCSKFTVIFSGHNVQSGSKEEVCESSIYYTTTLNRLLRNYDNNIFTFEDSITHIKDKDEMR